VFQWNRDTENIDDLDNCADEAAINTFISKMSKEGKKSF
jgi:hypothetical protein